MHIEVVYPAWIPENIDKNLYNLLDLCLSDRKLLAPVERAQNFTYSSVKTQKCQNFQIDHYNSKQLNYSDYPNKLYFEV